MGKERTFEDLQKYIHGQVSHIRAKLGPELKRQLELELPRAHAQVSQKQQLARFLWAHNKLQVMDMVRKYKDIHLVRIAECGHGESTPGFHTKLLDLDIRLDMRTPGRWLVAFIAAGAIIAALTDQLWDEVQKAKVEATKPMRLAAADDRTRVGRMFEEGNRFIAHCKSAVGGHWYFTSIESHELQLKIGCMFAVSPTSSAMRQKIELLKGRTAHWVPTEKELTIILEVFEDTGKSEKGNVLSTYVCWKS